MSLFTCRIDLQETLDAWIHGYFFYLNSLGPSISMVIGTEYTEFIYYNA